MSTSITTEMTKQLMANSLKKLMLEKPLNKISIRELVEDCGVNRQTFYYHFQDIYGLLEWILEKEVLSIIDDNDKFLTWQEAGLYLLKYMEDNSTILLCALNSLGRSAIKTFLYSDVKNVATKYITHIASDLDVLEEDFNHVVHYFTVCFGSLLEDWLSRGSKGSPEELIDILDTIVSGTARTALERFAEKRKAKL
jgi:probable dihydroxyacetone kinase regulator